jgi:hypothetical protein
VGLSGEHHESVLPGPSQRKIIIEIDVSDDDDDDDDDDEQTLAIEDRLPRVECNSPQHRCLIKLSRYRTFRAALYRLFADIKPKATQLPFDYVIRAVNKGLPIEKQFCSLEAKRILKFMRDKLLDSLCADRVTGVNLQEVKLYA